MAIKKTYEVIVTISYEDQNRKNENGFEKWIDCSTFRVTREYVNGPLQVDSLRPNLGEQNLYEVEAEMTDLLTRAKDKLKEKVTEVTNEITTKSVIE